VDERMTGQAAPRRKLIEVSLPLEDINRESAREKSIRHGHPSTLHLWWARRPLAAARATLFAQLVDDPSSRPELFSTPESQALERERLHDIIRKLVVWENVGDERLLRQARNEILKSTGGSPPSIVDPFAGGGTIPLEAQRLGLEAHASDLNPVAVLINKALIEIPPRFSGSAPVFPGSASEKLGSWVRAQGLAEDIRRYGSWVSGEAEARIGSLYPKAKLADGSDAPVIAWIWARTVRCQNPACGIETPLVRSWWLSKKKGQEAFIVPRVEAFPNASGRRFSYSVGHDLKDAPSPTIEGTVNRTGATCLACGGPIELKYIRSEGRSKRLGVQLLAIVAESHRRRIYLPPTEWHADAARVSRPENAPEGRLPDAALGFRVQAYGMIEWVDLFTPRQLVALTTFSDLVQEARVKVHSDALAAGIPDGLSLEAGGTGAAAYADAVATYLGLGVSRLADIANSLCRWENTKTQVRNLFSRQAISMVWDFAEAPAFGKAAGSFEVSLGSLIKVVEQMRAAGNAHVMQCDASTRSYENLLISTDPPYYDNIGYSDLSDFFYVWLRRSLGGVYPALLSTILVPKAEELVANPHRHGGGEGAAQFFERGFQHVFSRARESASGDYPMAVYYAFKQAELESEGVSSTGWATLLEGMIRSGWTITATWPVRSELGNRMRNQGSNALASSIILTLRPRDIAAQAISRRGFLSALKAELPRSLAEMRQGAIAPVDLAQSTIGPGMAVFSRYGRVVESDGSSMSVKTALALINQALDEVLTEMDGELDADSRFCLDWYRQNGWAERPFGEADVLARARNTSVDGLARGGALTSRAGRVRLLPPNELDPKWDPLADERISLWEATMQLARALDSQGTEATSALMSKVGQRLELDAVQMLAYRLYELTQASRPQDALLFNGLGTSWSDLSAAARRVPVTGAPAQSAMDFGEID
jgi:putative DNA methylase